MNKIMNFFRNSTQYIKVAFDFAMSIVVVILYEVVLNILKGLVSDSESYIVSLISATITIIVVFALYVLFRIFHNTMYRKLWFRKLFEPLAEFEGMWITRLDVPDRPKSIFKITYNFELKKYEYIGTAYGPEGDFKGDWYSCDLSYMSQGGFRFYATGHFIDGNDLKSTESSGYLVFEKLSENYHADGYTIDWSVKNDGCTKTHSVKITPDFLKTLINKKEIESEDDLKEVVKKYE